MTNINSINNNIDLSIIIINYNLAEEIENCLTSLLLKNIISSQQYEIIIVDNNSPDKKLYEVEKRFCQNNIHFFYSDKNLGFGKGCNYGFTQASGRFICFLNPDTLIEEDIFKPIMNLFENDPRIGIIGPKQQIRYSLFDFSAGLYPNLFFELFWLIGLGVFFEGFIINLYSKIKKNNYFQVDWILGAAIFISSELFKSVGGFDKDYFMFYEEVDLCKRVSNKGLKIIYYPQVKINHIGSVSGKKDYSLYVKRSYTSKYIFIQKHYKSLYKYLMILFLYGHVCVQLLIWSCLFLFKKNKAQQKLDGFLFLLKNRMKLS